jgi:NADPH:quinone reductase-like Zn-dependent oxidoreductase
MDTMMALRAHARGGPDKLTVEQAPVPAPRSGEVVVAVHAAGITFGELGWDPTWTAGDGTDRTPVIPSHEMSGVIAAMAEDAAGLIAGDPSPAVGDAVYGLIDFDRDGAAAEYAAVAARNLAVKPRKLSHIEAATLPLAALTAWQALVDHAEFKPGESVLVHGGAGGVGGYVVQLASMLGGHVIATGRPKDADFVLSLGASAFVADSRPFESVVADVDVVIDTVGGSVLDRSYGVLRTGGRLVTLSGAPSAERAEAARIRAIFFVVEPDSGELIQIGELADAGRLKPVVAQIFPLSEGREAYESGATQPRPPGKTVLTVR